MNADASRSSSHGTPPNFHLADAPVEGTVSGTVSPRTLSSSADENFHPDEPLPSFQLLNSTAGMPMGAPLYQYSKESTASTRTVIVDDTGEMPNGHGYSDVQSDPLMPFQNMFPFIPLVPDPWADATMNTTTETASPTDRSAPLPMGQPIATDEAQGLADYQNPMKSLELRWLNGLPPHLGFNGPFPANPQELSYQDRCQVGKDTWNYKSETSSVSGDFPGVCTGVNNGSPGFAEGNLGATNPRYMKWEDTSDEDVAADLSQPLTNTPAFVVSEDPSNFTVNSLPPRSKAPSATSQRTSSRSTPLSLQSVATVRKRKQRAAPIPSEQSNQKPLQIVQEDGQGGSIASADFISPPRGARRKGPLSLAGRANAGMRRKNKDTCVQCRLNKRKVCNIYISTARGANPL